MSEKAINFFRVFTKPFRIIADIILFKVYFNLKNNYKILEPFCHQDVLIVGNGPSLKKTPLSKINMVSIGMNKINLLFDSTQWRPSIITCVNGLVIRQNLDFFNLTKIPLILPVKAFYLGVKPRPNIIFIFIKASNRFSNDVKVLSEGCTVTFTALQIAAFLKPKSVNIVGVDHKFSYPTGSPYEIKKFKGEDNNHFHPDYFGVGKTWHDPQLQNVELSYRVFKQILTHQGVDVVNCTVGGKLEVFRRSKLEDEI